MPLFIIIYYVFYIISLFIT